MRTTTVGRWVPVVALGLLLPLLLAPGSDAAPGGTETAAPVVSGTVVDVAGQPLPGVEVRASRDAGDGTWQHSSVATTDASGRYHGELGPGTYRLYFRPSREDLAGEFWGGSYYVDQASTFVVDGVGSVSDKDAVLDEYATVTGVVSGPSTEEEIDARAIAYRKVGETWVKAFESGYELDRPPGRYVISRVVPGTYRVLLRGGPYFDRFWRDGATIDTATDVVVVGGAVVDGIDATLVPQGRIIGRLVNAAGYGVAGYRVQATGRGSFGTARFQATTDAQGNYVLGAVYPGSYELSFSRLGGPCTSATLAEDVVVSPSAPGVTTAVAAPVQELACRLQPVEDVQTFGFDPAFVGQPVGIVPPEWTVPDATITYQWYGLGVGAIPGATEWWHVPTYPYSILHLEVTATRPGFEPARLTFQTPVYPGAIRSKVLPRIKGKPRVGETLRVTRGTWNPAEVKIHRYQWLSDGRPIRGATGLRIAVTRKHLDRRLSVRFVVYTADGSYSAKEFATKPTKAIAPRR